MQVIEIGPLSSFFATTATDALVLTVLCLLGVFLFGVLLIILSLCCRYQRCSCRFWRPRRFGPVQEDQAPSALQIDEDEEFL